VSRYPLVSTVARRIRFAVILIHACLIFVCLIQQISYAQDMSPLSDSIRNVVLKSAPVSVELTPKPGGAAALEAARGGSGSVVLAVEGVMGTCSQPVRINVFLNRPDATLATSTDDTNFLGFLYLIPRRGQIRRNSQAFDLASVPSLDERRLSVTLVPITGESDTPKDLSLVIGQIYLQREQ
jgi:Protein of unknown function (DUF_B2219)